MAFIDNLTAVLFVIQFIFLVLTDYSLFRKGQQKQMTNVLILATGFLIVSTAIFLVIVGAGSFDELQDLYNLGILCIMIFTYATFYRKLHSHFRVLLTSALTMFVLKIFTYDVFHEKGIFFYLDTLAQTFLVVIVLGYYGNASLRAFNIVKDQPVKDHVKTRLQIMGYASWFAVIGNLPIWIAEIVTGTPYNKLKYGSELVILLVTITSCTFAVSMYLSWVMPTWFKNYLNRNMSIESMPESDDDEIFGTMDEVEDAEEEQTQDASSTNEMITYLASQLSTTSTLSQVEARRFIVRAIRQSLGYVPQHIRFRQWLLLIGEDLEQALKHAGHTNSHEMCGNLIGDLIQKQSLVTMISI